MPITVIIGLSGEVQGLGVRPRVAHLAVSNGVGGSVRNSRRGVEIVACGSRHSIDAFYRSLINGFPNAKMNCTCVDSGECHETFQILESDARGNADYVVPVDRAICDHCLAECFTPGDRRFGYALISCSHCGPRFTTIKAMPYDRQQTGMSDFAMCSACKSEYSDPTHRRYHSQNNACPLCGPTIAFWEGGDQRIEEHGAIEAAARAVLEGRILAMKGVGGYQLACDATVENVVVRLRQLKGRRSKPLAVMVESMEKARSLAKIDSIEHDALKSFVGPIVIVEAKSGNGLCWSVNTGLGQVGIMLPTTAMHALLLRQVGRPLVVTSGNREGEPLEFEEVQATIQLSGIADCFLHHNRPILRPIDDSVVRCMAGNPVTIRAARGLAPMPLDLELEHEVAALGGEQKSAIAISNGHRAILGPHLGDLHTLRSRDRFLEQQADLLDLMDCHPSAIAQDLHPDFFASRQIASVYAGGAESIQHHHAHIVSAMLEQGWLQRTVLGFAFDGMGFGSDGSFWGGEALLASVHEFQRVAHLLPLRLPGGERAIREPWRVAVALICDSLGEEALLSIWRNRLKKQWDSSEERLQSLLKWMNVDSLSPRTTSMGRLFDGVAAIVLGIDRCYFEGEAAMRLESSCIQLDDTAYTTAFSEDEPFEIDWRPMIREILRDLEGGLASGRIAMKFHRTIATCLWQIANRFPKFPVVLTGGVFQNRILVERVSDLFRNHLSPLGLPGRIPPNDGGLAAGQLIVANSRMTRGQPCA